MEYLQEKQAAHLLDYGGVLKLCVRKLAATYSDLGMSKEEQLQAFDKVTTAAEHVWTEACEGAGVELQALRDKIDKDLNDVLRIREALGDDEPDLELSQCQEEAASPRITLRSLHERVQQRLDHWRGRRAERMVEYEAAMAITSSLKSQLGQAQQVTRPDLSRANLDFLRMEQDKLRADKERRVRRLETLLGQLHDQCQELGENGKAAMSEVHHSLWHFRESRQAAAAGAVDASVAVGQGSSLGSTAGGASPAAAAAGGADAEVLLQGVELGDAMFERLVAKLDAVAQLKAEREAQLQQLSAVLGSLWEALHISPEAQERGTVSALMVGPDKLHTASIEACGAELSRLEQQQSRAMKDLVVAKAMELEKLCASSLMAAPDVTDLLLEMSQPARRESVGGPGQGHGQVSDVLNKIMRLIVEVRSETAKRSGLVAQVRELEEAQQELVWLHKYEHDENRFKGRDAHSNLQRSLRAAKLRERVPPLIRSMQQAAQGWRLREGAPFLVHGQDYAEEVLPEVARQLEQSLAEKAAPAKPKPASGSSTTGSSSKGAMLPSGGGGRAGGRTTQQHALTHQGLAERHSIAVPLGVAGAGAVPSTTARDAAPSKLSRSIDFKAASSTQGSSAGTIANDKSAPAPSNKRVPPGQGQTKPSTPVRPSASPPQQQHLTPVRNTSSVDRAAAAAVTPGVDPMQEKLARIIAAPPQAQASNGNVTGKAATRYPPSTPTQAQAALPTEVALDVDGKDVQSPRDNSKALRAALLSPKAMEAKEGTAAQGVLAGSRVSAATQLPAGQAKVVVQGAVVLPSPAKPSRIPRHV